MIIIAGTLDLVDPDGRDALVEAAVEYQRATRQEEPGCEAYCFAADPVVPGRIQVYELWTDEASLAAVRALIDLARANDLIIIAFADGVALTGERFGATVQADAAIFSGGQPTVLNERTDLSRAVAALS